MNKNNIFLNDCKIKANVYAVCRYNGKNIIVVPNTGAWVIGNENILSLLDECKESITLSELGQRIKNNDFYDIVNTLYHSGILQIDGKCCTDDIVKEEKEKSKEVAPRLLVTKYTNH